MPVSPYVSGYRLPLPCTSYDECACTDADHQSEASNEDDFSETASATGAVSLDVYEPERISRREACFAGYTQ